MSGHHTSSTLFPQKHHQSNSSTRVNNNNSKIKNDKNDKGKRGLGKPMISFKRNNDFNNNDQQDKIEDIIFDDGEDEHIFEFSEEIMIKNTRNQSRQQKERHKIKHLQIFDCMVLMSSHLGISKQVFYRAAFIMKRFMLLQQRLIHSKVTISNAKTYGLASLLISSKFENINGNFLTNISYITNNEGQGKLNKQQILEYELYILSILQFNLPNKIIVVQTIIQFINIWNQWIKGSLFQKYPIDFIINDFSLRYGLFMGQIANKKEQNSFQMFLYLIDFILVRKLLEIKLKDMNLLNKSQFYVEIMLNILYHIIFSQEQGPNYKLIKQKFRQFIKQYPVKDNFQLNISFIQRNSTLLNNQIKKMKNNQQKKQKISQVKNQYYKIIKSYCICWLKSQKYSKMPQIYAEDIKQFSNLNELNDKNSRKEDQNQTNLLQYEQRKKQNNEEIYVLNKIQHRDLANSQLCPICLKKDNIKHKLINYQKYIPLYVGTNKRK